MHSCLKPGNLSTSADYQTEDAVLLAEEAALGFSRTLDADGRACTTASKKQARARVWTVRGEGHVFINGKPMIDYFAHAQERHVLADVFEVARAFGRYNVWAVVEGSGASSQAAALAVAIARGLCIHQPELTEALKAHHMTTIDVRQVERKKLGRPKARKGHTWVKR
ncbi:hypothetical protein CXG81DRAFT_10536 [Caulochytrium protostelioides]|uniref:30S ribosomal protein S9 n=1 Tax=Caulochytrium protostelioides TaxID=1555241 RepID=A0A4P9XB64_9FUNG|nr:hypothetical protein CXG81DRAFT_10536 [Caulochytrium protostelioides]|eukprot:RKP02633.1 hypothetical protein CXG81DRAFT_10536 [Caulochytrium protostelioides]